MSEEKGGECLVIKADVRRRQKSFDAAEKCVKKIGGLNILVNNAAFQTFDVPNLYICDNSVSRRCSRPIRLDDYGLWAVVALGTAQSRIRHGNVQSFNRR